MKYSSIFLLSSSLLISGCGFIPFTHNQPTLKESSFCETEVHRDRYEVINGKRFLIAQDTEKSLEKNHKAVIPPKTLWQKLWGLVGGWALLMILGLFFPPVALVMGLINRTLSKAVTTMVSGIEEAKGKLDVQPKAMLLDTLSMKMDSDVKKLVAKTRSKIA